jgi:RHS repeat-associated protein
MSRVIRTILTLLMLLSTLSPAWAQPAETIEYYHVDVIGSVRAVTNQARQVVRQHDYFPFGDGSNGVAAGQDPLRFTGKERDPESGLDYFGRRYYVSRIGRFASVDPDLGVETALFDPQRWNRYSYVGNRPYRIVDPDGRGWVSTLVKVAKATVKGGNIGSAFAGAAEDVSTIFSTDARVGTSERLWATASLVSEGLPLSGRDISAGGGIVSRVAAKATAEWHHIATDKSVVTGWTATFKKMFNRAGMSMQDADNIVLLEGHKGRHAKAYHQYVLDFLTQATRGLEGHEYARAFRHALRELKHQLLQDPTMVKGKGLPQ